MTPTFNRYFLCLLFYFCSFFISLDAHATFIVGHRGARGLAPESTLEGYKIAIKEGVQYIDMDVVMTKDHQLAVFHDLALNKNITRDKHGNFIENEILIKNLTLRELKNYNVGAIKPGTAYQRLFPHQRILSRASIRSLQEVITYAKKLNPTIRFQIEIKTDPLLPNASFSPDVIAKKLIAVLTALNVTERTRIQAFDWRCLYAIQKENPRIHTAYLTSKDQVMLMFSEDPKIAGLWTGGKLLKNYNYSLPEMIKTLGGSAWDPESHSLHTNDRLRASQLGLQVVVWSDTKDSDYDAKEIKRILQLKVDGIISDRPDLALHQLHLNELT